MFIINSRFYISHVEALFVVAKIMESPGKMIAYCFIQNYFKRDHDHDKVMSVIMTIRVGYCCDWQRTNNFA